MSLDLALENYPKEVTTRAGLKLNLRPLKATDCDAYHALFKAMPEADLMYIKHRVGDIETVQGWCEAIDLGHNLPLLALDGAKIIGAATLHQKLGGWRRHIGRISVLTDPSYRGNGMGYALTREIIDLARQSGLQRLEAEFIAEQVSALTLFAHHGFSELFRLEDYVKDMQAIEHDYVLMGLELTTDEEYAGMG
jgi:L-amino acid N-acyltransferase YncA